jgi:hypothetical protein
MGLLNQCFVQPGWQGAGRKGGKGPGKRGFAGHLTRSLPATQTAQGFVGGQHLDQQTGGWKVEHSFGEKGPRQYRAFGGWAAWKPRPAGQERLDPHHPQNADQLLMVPTQWTAGGIVESGQKFFLNADPVCG